ncbi:hypothetical protein A9K72_09085 [Mesorhizobium loti]|uniref:hypothetical protein n=1 Tax=Mesorhizobium jarvisii TaxID=1777867 RepID=UPI0007EC73B4|nr:MULTISPECIES: hypothetical protein [Mesorhizobium]OBQ69386.1 hypothetical protein A9K72_09085 [Mesorhizobium loti]
MANKPRTFRPSHLPSREDAARLYDHDRDQQPWRRWYKTARWQRLRAHQLAEEPLCRNCKKHGRITAATVCDHIERHGGDPDRFWNGPFQSLCDQAPWRCHSSEKQRQERQDGGRVKSLDP